MCRGCEWPRDQNARVMHRVACVRCSKEHIDHIIVKARIGLTAIGVVAATQCEQRLMFLSYEGQVLSVIEYDLAFLTLSRP